ncbi:regulators of stationary/sporulation gene expression [Candidatus Scalindua japonica]|uniref:Regulators of stationary/sporulation gene expression n=2 Tax=Candidatus Scalindua TaxID=236756 RepID=A0A286TUQ1_9BACT|nr:AbrB/MazE/SpoVT family DNA-binding domain-containing protein [Candidatus Scalindua japonica]GAX59575.1 regulators of stationary/sporulation gene expression [Candidatus Scalindua japonica]
MLVSKLTSKGQITIPRKVRERLGISTGDKIQFKEKNGIFIIKKSVKESPFDKWIGYLKDKNKNTDTIIEEIRGR